MTEDRGLVCFFITFEPEPLTPNPPGTIQLDGGRWGPESVGVTACDRADALALVRERFWPDGGMPAVDSVIEDADVSALAIDGLPPGCFL